MAELYPRIHLPIQTVGPFCNLEVDVETVSAHFSISLFERN